MQEQEDPAMSMSKASISVFEMGLNVLSALLDKAEAYAEAKRMDPIVLLGTSLFPGMFAFSRQIVRACDGSSAHGRNRRDAAVDQEVCPDDVRRIV
jgi:hypothetical protein